MASHLSYKLFIIIWFVNKVKQLDINPKYCFNEGNCSFAVEEAEYGICSILCGSKTRINYSCPSNFDDFECPLKYYGDDYISEGNAGLVKLKIQFNFCQFNNSCSDSAFATVFPIWHSKPIFSYVKSSFSIYDEIEHNISIEGTNFNAFYQPFIVIHFDRSKLIRETLRQSCQCIISCSVKSENLLNCYKPAFNESCIPQTPGEMGDWEANADFYSHNAKQTDNLMKKRFSVNNKPMFTAIAWNSDKNMVVIDKTGYVFPNTSAMCHRTDQSDQDFFISTIFASANTVFFHVNDRSLVKKTINCTLVFDIHLFPVGTVTIDSMNFNFLSGISTQEIILISAVGLILMLAVLLGALITFSGSAREDKIERQGEIIQNSLFNVIRAKFKTLASLQTGRFSL